jgi:hypothetical protein
MTHLSRVPVRLNLAQSSHQGSFVVGTVPVPTLSASAPAFVPAASVHSSVSASVSVSAPEKSSASSGFLKPGLSVSHKQVLKTPLAGLVRGRGPTSEGQTSELGEMIVIKTADQFLCDVGRESLLVC